MTQKITIEVPDEVYAWLTERAKEHSEAGNITREQLAAEVITESLVEGQERDRNNPCDIEVGYHNGSCFWCQYHQLKPWAAISSSPHHEEAA